MRLVCSYDPDTLGSNPDRPVKGVIHWVSAEHSLPAEVRLYDRLYSVPDPLNVPDGEDLTYHLNPDSLVVLPNARIEPSVLGDPADTRYQFERTGYFWRDPVDSGEDGLVFNRIVTLRDTWGKKGASAAEAEGGAAGSREGAAPAPTGETAPTGKTAPTRDAAPSSPPGPEPADRISDERRSAREADPDLAARYERYQSDLGLRSDEADLLSASHDVGELFEAMLAAEAPAEVAANWLTNEVLRELKERDVESVSELGLDGAGLARLIAMVEGGEVLRSGSRRCWSR